VNTKLYCCPVVCWPVTLELELEVPLLLDDPPIEGRSKLHGTATCLPVAEEDALEALGEVPEALVPELLPELLTESTAKSTRPDAGLMMTSLIVPTSLPELLLISAPVN
jgi:hypothetical protein